MAAGSIVVDLLMKTGSFETDTKRAEKRSREMAREIDKAFKMVGVAVAAAGAAFVAMTKSVINSADQVAKASRSIGIATESLSALQFAAELSGVSSDQLSQSLLRLNKSAADGNQAFEAMGIKVKDAQGNLKATDTLLKEVSDKFASYADGAEKSALAQELFGRSGAQMISFLNSGSQGLDEMRQEAERLGVVIDSELARNAEIFNDNLKKMRDALDGAALKVANDVLPILIELTNAINDSEEGMSALQTVSKGVLVAFEAIVILGSDVAFVFKGIAREIAGTAAQINRLLALDFEGFAFIAENVREDSRRARAELDAFQQRVLGFRTGIAAPEPTPTPSTGQRAPRVGRAARDEKPFDFSGMDREIDKISRQFDALERERLNKIRAFEAEAARLYRATRTPLEELNIEQAKLNELLEKGHIDWDTYARGVFAAQDAFEAANESTKEANQLAKDLGFTFSSAFEDAIVMGKKLSDVLRGLAQDIIRIAARRMITEPLAAGISGALSGMFGGFRADGGPVTGGGTYMVGERGPELFVPNTSGMIVPHEALQGGGGGVVVQQTINVTTGVQQTVRAEILTLMPQIANAAKAAVSDAKLRGGSYAAALR